MKINLKIFLQRFTELELLQDCVSQASLLQCCFPNVALTLRIVIFHQSNYILILFILRLEVTNFIEDVATETFFNKRVNEI